MTINCHGCGTPAPDDAKRCYVFNHPFCAPCWDKLLPPDPEDYHRMMDEALKPPQPEVTCPECGQTPMGEACYNICPNSNHYYSPEQERADDANYGADRWEGWGDPEPYDYEDTPEDHGAGGGDPDDPPLCYMGHEYCYDRHEIDRLADEADWEEARQRDMQRDADNFLEQFETSGPGWPD